MSEQNYQYIPGKNVGIKAWVNGVEIEPEAKEQLENIASMPFIHRHVAAMPDVHWGMGATVGSVIPTKKAIIPAAVGVDIGCGMIATRTTLTASDLPDNLFEIRNAIEKAVPHGRTNQGGKGDRGAWGEVPTFLKISWGTFLEQGFRSILEKHPKIGDHNALNHLGTLGTGNHFIEICLDEEQKVWVMLHSGSRGVGNRIGRYFIERAKEEMQKYFVHLPDQNLAYLPEGSKYFEDYIESLDWAQEFASRNRQIMMANTISALLTFFKDTRFNIEWDQTGVNCHHNYVAKENHFGQNVWVTRKGAVRARKDDFGIIPGSMGARSYIVKGKGSPESFHSCSHGAGRKMSRGEAKRRFTLEDHAKATEGVECRKDADVLDETPGAYKDIDAVMEAQSDLVEVVHTLKQVLCVKG